MEDATYPQSDSTRTADRSKDPSVYCTYFGSGQQWTDEAFSDIVIDDEGYAYLIGTTSATDLPTTPGVYQPQSNGWKDAFVCKFNPTLSSLIWCTYLGGNDWDSGSAIRLGDDGDLYVTGWTRSSDFPIVPSSSGSALNGRNDAFVCRMSRDGTDLKLSTLLGGSDFEYVSEMELDGKGHVYILGDTGSSDLNGTSEAPQPNYMDGGRDGFIARFNTSDMSLDFASYIGGSGSDHASDLSIDGRGSVYISGRTNSTDLNTTTTALQRGYKGGYYDGFVCKLSSDGSSFIYMTYLGGRYIDDIGGLVVDKEGSVIVTGDTNSSDFPQPTGITFLENGHYPTDADVFVCKLGPNGASVDFTTFVGGTDEMEAGNSIALDEDGYIYVTGVVWSSDFPTTNHTFQSSPGESSGPVFDSFVFMLSPDGSILEYASYVGGSDYDWSVAITVDDGGNVYIAGSTRSEDLPTTEDAYQSEFGGSTEDAYICRLPTDFEPPIANAGEDVRFEQATTVHFNGTGSWDDRMVINWAWSFTYDGAPVVLTGPHQTFYFELPGDYQVTLSVTDAAGNIAEDTMTVHYIAIEPPVADAGVDMVVDQHEVVTFNGSGSRDNIAVVNWTWELYYDGTWLELYGQVTEHLFDFASDYEIKLLVRDAAGRVAMDTVSVFVRDTTYPIADAGPDLEVGTEVQITLDGSASTDNVGIIRWRWTFYDRGLEVELLGETVTYVFELIGEYDLTLTVRDDAGLWSNDTMTITVSDLTPPIADAGEDIEVDQGSKVSFSGIQSSDNVGIAEWHWTIDYGGEQIHLEGMEVSFVFDRAGTFKGNLTVEDGEGNSASDEMFVTVRDITAPIAITDRERIIDMGSTIVLDASQSSDNVAITHYNWYFESQGKYIHLWGAKSSHRFGVPGRYSITLTIADAAGNTDTDVLILTVVDTELPVIVLLGPRSVDLGEELVLDASGSSDNVEIVEYKWVIRVKSKNVVSYNDHFRRTFDTPGEYMVILTVKDAEGNIDTMEYGIKVDGDSSAYWILACVIILVSVVTLFVLWRKRNIEKDDV